MPCHSPAAFRNACFSGEHLPLLLLLLSLLWCHRLLLPGVHCWPCMQVRACKGQQCGQVPPLAALRCRSTTLLMQELIASNNKLSGALPVSTLPTLHMHMPCSLPAGMSGEGRLGMSQCGVVQPGSPPCFALPLPGHEPWERRALAPSAAAGQREPAYAAYRRRTPSLPPARHRNCTWLRLFYLPAV